MLASTRNTILTRWHCDGLTANEALEQCRRLLDESATGLVYTPRRCWIGRVTNEPAATSWKPGPTAGNTTAATENDILTNGFELRVFCEAFELRWLHRENSRGRASILCDADANNLQPSAPTGWVAAPSQSVERLENQYLLWGEALTPTDESGWTTLTAGAIGELTVPCVNATVEQRLFLKTYEYISRGTDDPEWDDGNVVVIEERMREITVTTK